eukprot:Clim_evm35s243 gene=Clim_evmTU35s243
MSDKIKAGCVDNPIPDGLKYTYGTAGFRMHADKLPPAMFRIGVLAALRSQAQGGKRIGVMITASHNPEEDNGVKVVDPLGEMLESSWEACATQLANASADGVEAVVKSIIEDQKVDTTVKPLVVVGRDTRPSGEALLAKCVAGIEATGGTVQDLGIVTTPQLHYIVCCLNTNGEYGEPTEEGYFTKLSTAYKEVLDTGVTAAAHKTQKLMIDAANGVGAPKARAFGEKLAGVLEITVYNDGTTGKLNHDCGADYVKVGQKAPAGMDLKPGDRAASLDGDADRVVYYYVNDDGKFCLLDGDKIATLAATALTDLFTAIGLDTKIAVVQTAYANGSSTKYITQELKLQAPFTPTGVKHLHHEAVKHDVGVYFEANGHGTVIFSPATKQRLAGVDVNALNDTGKTAYKTLSALVRVINETVGDALSDILLVEACLALKGWSLSEWNSKYNDLPNRQMKVRVADRTAITTTNAEQTVVTPEGLQEAIDEIVRKYPSGRSFVRPSGTEDVVRVYAEAETREQCDELAVTVALKTYELAGGVGDKPQPFV